MSDQVLYRRLDTAQINGNAWNMQNRCREHPDRSSTTRAAIVQALAEQSATRRYSAIRTGELIAAARIARSTFYEHFRSKVDVLVAMLDPILLPLANAAANRAARPVMIRMLAHVYANRHLFRNVLEGRERAAIRRRLSAMIAERRKRDGTPPSPLLDAATASGQITILRHWIRGDQPLAPSELADQLLDFSAHRQRR